MKRGDRYIAHPTWPWRQRFYILVTRVAKDGTWADIVVRNCFVQWTKRQPLINGEFHPNAETIPSGWSRRTLDVQERHWDDEAIAAMS